MNQLDWEDLKTLAAIAKMGTVREAARSLSIHHSTVSRRIERLEQAAGTRLFDRRPEGLLLTDPGEQLVAEAQRFEDSLLQAEARIIGSDADLSGIVTVTVAEPVAVRLLLPALPQFLERYPQIEVHWRLTADLLDVSRREADVAIRMDNNPPEALIGKPLFAYLQAVYCARDYLAAHDLKARPESGQWLGWAPEDAGFPAWTQDTGFAQVPARGAYPTIEAQLAACRSGLGLALLPCLVADEDPLLVRATDQPPTSGRMIWVVTHRDLRRTARVRAVMQFAEETLRAGEHRFRGARAD